MKLIIFLALLMGNVLTYGNQLTVGVLKFAPPFTSEIGNSNHYFGFCIDMMQEICSRLKASCHYKSADLGKQLEALRQGVVDVTFLTNPIDPEENKDYIFSLPYVPSTGQFVVLNGSNIHSIDELQDKKIGVLQASSLKKPILSRYTSLERVQEFAKSFDLLNALATHQVDAMLLNSSVAKYLANNAVYNLKMLGQPIELGMGYGIAALPKNAELVDKINKALLQMEHDGTYITIYNKYFGF